MAKFSASMVIAAITWLVVPTAVQALASSMEQDKKEREGKEERERHNKFIPFQKFIESVEGANARDFLSRPTSRVKDAESFEQMRQYVLGLYEGVSVRHSWVLGSQYFDCVPVEQQPTARALGIENLDLTQPSPVPHPSGGQLPEGVITLTSPLGPDEQHDQFGNSRLCEVGTIPMDRITLDRLIPFSTLGQFFQKGPGIVELPPGEPPEPPDGPASSGQALPYALGSRPPPTGSMARTETCQGTRSPQHREPAVGKSLYCRGWGGGVGPAAGRRAGKPQRAPGKRRC
jgi:hypothetical protein